MGTRVYYIQLIKQSWARDNTAATMLQFFSVQKSCCVLHYGYIFFVDTPLRHRVLNGFLILFYTESLTFYLALWQCRCREAKLLSTFMKCPNTSSIIQLA